MPKLLLIAASGTAQRRLLEETASDLEKNGYTAAGRQEGGEWNSLLSDNMTGGLFDENRYIVVEGAPLLGAFPEKLSGLAEKEASVAVILVYESDAKNAPAKFIPKDVIAKCSVLKPSEFPRWPRERQTWTMNLAKELGVELAPDGAAMLVELLEDPEEIRSQLKSLGLFRKGARACAADVEQLCLDDGSRNLLKFLDGICAGDYRNVLHSLRALEKSGEMIPLLVPLHNRMRLAWYAGLGRDSLAFAKALGAKDYAWRMAKQADQNYGHKAVAEFIYALIRMNIEERSGAGAGWNALEAAVIELMSAAGTK